MDLEDEKQLEHIVSIIEKSYVYFYNIQAGEFTGTKKMVIAK